jgi:hypothetical protein
MKDSFDVGMPYSSAMIVIDRPDGLFLRRFN